MDPEVVRRTQESLGKVIRKPPLTDKLLGKPPFRYLHDILTEVTRTTGFFKGLYTESELKSDNVKDKDAKITFLQKAIDVVTLVTGEPLAVKPARVVAGHEPDKTNEFLQAIGKCCLNKLSSDDAVKRILSGEKVDPKGKPPSSSKSQDKENREAKDDEKRSHKEKEDKRETEIRERSGSRDRKQHKEEEKKERERRKERERNGEIERDGLREGENNEKEKNRVKESETDKERSKEKSEREKGRERERRSEGSHGKEKDRTREKVRERERDQERNPEKEKDSEHRSRDRDNDHGERSRDREQEKTRTRDRDKERRRERDPEKERRKERGRDNDSKSGRDVKAQDDERTERKHKASEDSTKKASEVSSGEDKLSTDKESSHGVDEKSLNQSKTSRPSASKLRERRPAKPSGDGETGSDEEGGAAELHNLEGRDAAEANIAAQRKIPRPGSARPAPPRVRRQASAEVIAPERVSSGKAVSNVIVDKQKDDGDDDDDNEFVVEEAAPQLSEMPTMEQDPELDLTGDEKHGSLVKKILETKKDYETQHVAVSKEKLLLNDTGRKKEKDLVTKEIEKLRSSIQILCRSALPLGKMMDYIQEDMDTMKNELQIWRTENREHAEVLQREQSVTDTAVDPLKAELAELEQLIKEQRDKICTVKGNILRNEEKIQKMVQSIGVSGRD